MPILKIFNITTLNKFLQLKTEQYKGVEEIEFSQLHTWIPTLDVERLTSLNYILAQCPLKEIFLENTRSSALSDGCFQKFCNILPQCQMLETLRFGYGSLNALSANRLQALIETLSTCEKLKEIVLEENKIGEWDDLRLKVLGKGLLNCQALEKIHLGHNSLNKLKIFGIQALFGFLSLSSVQALYLQGNELGRLDSPRLIELGGICAQFECLKILHISYNSFNELNPAGFKAFFDSLSLSSSVQELYLEANSLGNFKLAIPCLTALGEACAKLKNLRVLSLAQNRFQQLEGSYIQALAIGIIKSETLHTIEGIQDFTSPYRKMLDKTLIRNQQRLNEQKLIEIELKQFPLKIKMLIFSYAHPQLPETLLSSAVPEAADDFPDAKRLKTG